MNRLMIIIYNWGTRNNVHIVLAVCAYIYFQRFFPRHFHRERKRVYTYFFFFGYIFMYLINSHLKIYRARILNHNFEKDFDKLKQVFLRKILQIVINWIEQYINSTTSVILVTSSCPSLFEASREIRQGDMSPTSFF